MKNLTKLFLGCTILLSATLVTRADSGTVRRHLTEVSCIQDGGEVSIGAACTNGSGSCIENPCPRGTSPQL